MTEKDTAIKIVEKLQNHGFVAVFVGGCVRDELIAGRTPKDFDIATTATPDHIEALFTDTIPVGRSFGVIVVKKNSFVFEVATCRTECSYTNGRTPSSVAFASSLQEDAKRRDFTMNAIYYDPIDGTTYDFFGGELDIKDRIIAAVGEPSERFKEDKLRMLRAIRFACQLNFDIEDYTWSAICENASQIKEVSNERIKMEADKILTSEFPVKGIRLLKACGILKEILPEVDVLDTVEQSKKWHSEGNAFEHTMFTLYTTRQETKDIDCLWGALLHDVGKSVTAKMVDGIIKHTGHAKEGATMSEEIMNRLKVSSEHKRNVVAIVENHMKIKAANEMKKSKLRRIMAEPYFDKLVLVSCADSKSAIPAKVEDGISKLKWYVRIKELKEEFKNEKKLPKCFIGGKDLITIGLTPSPLFTEILTEVMNLQLEGEIHNKEEALDFIRRSHV